VSPFAFAGPTRFHEPPLPLEELPPLDAVMISHDHYDHLDEFTVRGMVWVNTAWHAGVDGSQRKHNATIRACM